jgi:hypothetical protein
MELTFSAFSSQISEMEIQISGLKEQLDKEHQKWRSSQTNYERQVRTHFFIYIAYMSCLFDYLGYSTADAVWLHDLLAFVVIIKCIFSRLLDNLD